MVVIWIKVYCGEGPEVAPWGLSGYQLGLFDGLAN